MLGGMLYHHRPCDIIVYLPSHGHIILILDLTGEWGPHRCNHIPTRSRRALQGNASIYRCHHPFDRLGTKDSPVVPYAKPHANK